MRHVFRVWIIVSIALSLTLISVAQDGKGHAPDADEMMKKLLEAAAPGEAHKKLDPFVGSWETTTSVWTGGLSHPPVVTKGSSQFSWVLGGRFLKQEYSGTMMGQPMSGIGYSGYDNMRKKYTTFWIDNFGTGMSSGDGNFDQSRTILTYYGKMDQPITGEYDKNVKYVLRWTDKDSFVFEIHHLSEGEPNTKVVEVAYSRKK